MFLDSANPVVRNAVQVPQSPFNSLDNTKTSSMGTSLASSPKACYMRHHPNLLPFGQDRQKGGGSNDH